MRTYGKLNGVWVEVSTDSFGNDDGVWITTLCQTLKLFLGESPFFATYGIPSQQSIVTQIFPDFYVAQVQSQFSQYFASLQIQRRPQRSAIPSDPIYDVNIVTHRGAVIPTIAV